MCKTWRPSCLLLISSVFLFKALLFFFFFLAEFIFFLPFQAVKYSLLLFRALDYFCITAVLMLFKSWDVFNLFIRHKFSLINWGSQKEPLLRQQLEFSSRMVNVYLFIFFLESFKTTSIFLGCVIPHILLSLSQPGEPRKGNGSCSGHAVNFNML